jgi:hypothetical protein
MPVPNALPSPAALAPAPPPLPAISKTTEHAFAAFENLVGGRAPLAAALSLVEDGKGAAGMVAGLLADPVYDEIPLGVLCRKARITLKQLMDLYREASLVQAHVGAIQHVARSLPAVASDVMTRAVTHWVTCTACNGLGEVTPDPTKEIPNPSPGPCRSCNGRGQLACEPDHDTQKTALSLGGLLKKDVGGVNVSVTQQSATVIGGAGGFDAVVEKMDQILFGDARSRLSGLRQTAFVEQPAAQASPASPAAPVIDAEIASPASPASPAPSSSEDRPCP